MHTEICIFIATCYAHYAYAIADRIDFEYAMPRMMFCYRTAYNVHQYFASLLVYTIPANSPWTYTSFIIG